MGKVEQVIVEPIKDMGAESKEHRVQKGFEKVLNRHGYGFQYAVLKLAAELYEQSKSAWFFTVAEFPVEVQGYGTRIDFILSRSTRNLGHSRQPLLLVAECKRANPALSNWAFSRAPYTGTVVGPIVLSGR